MLKGVFLNDDSVCRTFCCDFSKGEIMKLRQKHARLAYTFGILLLGIFSAFAKNYSQDMFWFVYSDLVCYTNTVLNTCFTIVMIYRIATVIVVYHLIMLIFSAVRNKFAYQLVDYCWTIKIIGFMWLFFLACVIPNWFFIFWGMIFKYYTCLFTLIHIVFLYDSLFYYANKGRYGKKKNFSKLWIFTAWFFGSIFFLGGLGLFIYSFIEYNGICGQYKAINIVLLCLGILQLIINFIKYQVKVEITSSLFFFFVISIQAFGLITATPYNVCVSSANQSFIETKATTNVDIAFNFFFMMIVLVFISRETMTGLTVTLPKYNRALYQPIILDFEEQDVVVQREEFEETRFKNNKHVKTKVKRNKKDVGFHFYMMSIGAYFAAIFTNWTSIYEFENTSDEIVDNHTIWYRFSAIILGVVIAVTLSALNLKNIAKY